MIRQRPLSAERGYRDIGGGRPAIIHVKLLQQAPQPLSRFLLVGAFRAVVDFSVFNVLLASTSSTQIAWVLAANTVAFGTAMLASYLLNARYTFNAPWQPGSLGRYATIAASGVAIYNAALWALQVSMSADSVAEINVAKALAVAPSAAWNYLGYRHFAFPHRGAQQR